MADRRRLLLAGRVHFPCPGDEFAADLRKLNRPMLVEGLHGEGCGQPIDAAALGGVVTTDDEAFFGVPPSAESARLLHLCSKWSSTDWFLIEDTLTTEGNQRDLRDLASGGRVQ